ncbi:MAG TPA: 30S ribosomal protein S4, partial [Zymomonas mobilis]|nr:30S ribosomal protein S4 [Zymomonas mobilis]
MAARFRIRLSVIPKFDNNAIEVISMSKRHSSKYKIDRRMG